MGGSLSGLGVQLVTVWQPIAQIQAAYGPQARAILTNHPTKLFYPGMSDVDGLQTASTLMGHEHVPGMLQRSYLRPEEAGPSLVQFAPPDIVRQLKPGTSLLLSNTLPPAVIDLLGPGRDR